MVFTTVIVLHYLEDFSAIVLEHSDGDYEVQAYTVQVVQLVVSAMSLVTGTWSVNSGEKNNISLLDKVAIKILWKKFKTDGQVFI